MGKGERKAYLAAIQGRYRKANRAQKSKILDEFCAVCGYHRKYALRCLNRSSKHHGLGKPGRPSQYADAALIAVLRTIWLATDQMASKRLVAALALWLPHYEAIYGLLDDQTRDKLLRISAASIAAPQAHARPGGPTRSHSHQARHPAQTPDPASDRFLGRLAPRIHRGRYRGALRR